MLPTRIAITIVVLFQLAQLPAAAHPQEARFRPAIPTGQYSVGYSTQVRLDFSREYRPEFLRERGPEDGGKLPRPLLVNVWYPARGADSPLPMSYRSYFDLSSENDRVQRWADELSRYAEQTACSETFGKEFGELDPAEAQVWEEFLDSPTSCIRNAEAIDGKFPLVIYHSGAASSFDDNALLCEYLASYGYVVVGSAYPRADGRSLNIDARNGSVQDLLALVQIAVDDFAADWQRIAFVGHSAGAQAVLRAMSQPDSPADAFVLIDSTVDYYGVSIPTFSELAESAIANASAVDEPMLVAAGPGAIFELCDSLPAADRLYMTIPDLGHNEFISQGIFRLRMLKRLPDSALDDSAKADLSMAPDKEERFRVLTMTIREFLDVHLRGIASTLNERAPGDGAAYDSLSKIAYQFVERGRVQPANYDPAFDRPPFPREVKQVLQDFGVRRFCDLLIEHSESHADNPVYRNQMLFGSLLFELCRADQVDDARFLHETGLTLKIDGLSTLRFLAFMSQLGSRKERAIEYLAAALQVSPSDEAAQQKLAELQESDQE